jgi:hypothetical protein
MNDQLRPPRGGQAGRATEGGALVEVLASTLLMSILGAMAYGFARAALLSVNVVDMLGEVQEVAALTASMMAREVRLAGFSASGGAVDGLRVAASEHIEVAADLNGDGDTDDAHEVVAYRYDPASRQLQRATSGGSAPPYVTGVPPGGVQFSFYDMTGAALPTTPSGLGVDDRRRVRSIDARLAVALPHPDPRMTPPLSAVATTSVCLRNESAP